MIVAVTGASGFVGRQLIGRLTTEGYKVRALIHRHRPDLFRSENIESVEADIHDRTSLLKVFDGIEAVFHLVGIIAETRSLTFQKTVVEGTENVVESAQETGVRHIVYLSGVGTSTEAVTRYHQSKWQAEEIIRNSGLIYTILRASIIFGPEDKFINRFLKIIKMSPVIPIIGGGQYQLQPIFVGDAAAMMAASLKNDQAYNETVEIGGPDILAFKTIVEMLKRYLNKRRINIYLPWWLMRLSAALLERIMKPAPITKDQLTMLKAGSVCDNKKMSRIFGIELTGLEENLELYMR